MVGETHDHRQHESGHRHVVHKRRHDAGADHNDDNHRDFVLAGYSANKAADDVGHAGECQAAAEYEDGPNCDNGRIAETGQCFDRAYQPCQCYGPEGKESGHLHGNPFGYEQDDRGPQYKERQGNIGRQ